MPVDAAASSEFSFEGQVPSVDFKYSPLCTVALSSQ